MQAPTKKAYVVRSIKNVTEEQRRAVLHATDNNVFLYPADFLTCDYLSDSGTSSMFDTQWAALMLGDESYGRNRGYYVLLDAMRDVIERGDSPNNLWKKILSNESDVQRLMDEVYLTSVEGGFVNGGAAQLHRPNAFILPQGRCAEATLFSTLKESLVEQGKNPADYYIISNGFFDTTGAHVSCSGFCAINLFDPAVILGDFEVANVGKKNPFKGNLDIAKFKSTIDRVGADKILMLVMTITNNSAAGQPVSLANLKEASRVAHENNIPVMFDSCRFAENAYFIKKYEAGYENWSVRKIAQEFFKYADVLTFSLKKDGLANMGGFLCFKDDSLFTKRFQPKHETIGHLMKAKQILNYGNDSYGGMSGRDIMAVSVGLSEVMNEEYLADRIGQVEYLAVELAKRDIPVVLPPGGHGIYIDMDKFTAGMNCNPLDFYGVGFTVELIAKYGIRGCELGPFAFEWDLKVRPEEKASCVLNLVRFAIPRNMYSKEHMDYTVYAISDLYKHRDTVPKCRIAYGKDVPLRHFQAGLTLEYPANSPHKSR